MLFRLLAEEEMKEADPKKMVGLLGGSAQNGTDAPDGDQEHPGMRG